MAGETPSVDPELEAWLRELWSRRDLPFPEINRKQAWLIPSAAALANPNGTAPGWWVDRPDGRVVVLLPGPPREMRPMWTGLVLPRLVERGLGRGLISRTLRLTGIGESQVADLIGEATLRRTNPEIATYARAEAIDVRISATARRGRSAEELLDEAESLVLERLGEYLWARGSTTWTEAIGSELSRLGWSLAITEDGTDGSLGVLLGGLAGLRRVELTALGPAGRPATEAAARDLAGRAGAEVGLAVSARPKGADTTIQVAIASPRGERTERRLGFLGGSAGRGRAALIAAAALLRTLRSIDG